MISCLALGLGLLIAAGRQDEQLAAGVPVALELHTEDAPLVEGRGPGRVFEYEVLETGVVFLHAISEEFDPFLRVESADGLRLGESDDDGGGTTAFVRLDLEQGDFVYVLVVASSEGGAGRGSLVVHEAAETQRTRAAAQRVREEIAARRAASAPDWDEARAEARELLDELLAVPGAHDSTAVADALHELAAHAHGLALFDVAERAARTSLAHRERVLPPDHLQLQLIRHVLAVVLGELGRYEEALPLLEAAVASYPLALPAHDEDVLNARAELADLVRLMGDAEEARRLQAELVVDRRRTRLESDADLLTDRVHLALFQAEVGDLGGARGLLESVIADCERFGVVGRVPLLARQNLGYVLLLLGDPRGAVSIQRVVLRSLEESLPDGHPRIQQARIGLALALVQLDESDEAIALYELVLQTGAGERQPSVLWARNDLARALLERGEAERSNRLVAALEEELVAGGYDPGHPLRIDLAETRVDTLLELGESEEAAELARDVLAQRARLLGDSHRDAQSARLGLTRALVDLGRTEEARAELRALFDGLLRWSRDGLALAPRERRERSAWAQQVTTAILVALDRLPPEPELDRRAFGVIETLRAGEAGGSRIPATPDHAELRAEVLRARRAVDALARRWNQEPGGVLGEELSEAVLARDRTEAALSRRLVGPDRAPVIEADRLAERLGERAAAVGFVVRADAEPTLVAHVLRSSGELRRVPLGSLASVRRGVHAWRTAIGRASSTATRGERIVPAGTAASSVRLGRELRAAILDPVLEAAGDVERLFICLDGPLHLVPLDALPLDESGALLVGDRLAIHTEVSFARLLAVAPPTPSTGGLLAIGDVDFDAAGSAAGPSFAPSFLRSAGRSFPPLPATRAEVDGIAALYREHVNAGVEVLTGSKATKRALAERAGGFRYLHVASHGYFADGPRASAGTTGPLSGLVSTAGAPLAQCGIALAGANTGMDPLGRVPGILTGEELAGMDLAGCELAVLSACETNVGEVGNGRSLLSLQAALRSAGVRSAVTSLWAVPDAATTELMLAFYDACLRGGRTKAEALWEAKRSLRTRGAPPGHWAGWVLTGDPG